MLRIDPAQPPLWRTPTILQFGDRPVLVLNDPARWQQRLVRELERGIPDQAAVPFAIALGAEPRAAEDFVTRLSAVLAGPDPSPPPVLVEAAEDVPHDRVAAISTALIAAGCAVVTSDARADVATVVVVAQHLVAPSAAAPSWPTTARMCRSCSPPPAPRSDPT
nr:hypothetical protein GCM10025699_32170 [Microbacterium flavescens]